ncbi:DUF1240 domain-containing protein [Proteus mirabilis]|uniref:DUF1240 domain-containing protein n=1 Tax=Proteus mirabilis TaxID=584 RepID=UPI0018C84F3A|nr:DUF1240 domain-containing protein [Proteus mirabilis]MBG6016842.1 DUF1240 domain-containing protein [Proteus mirabilis]MDX4948225.1 DUF1240 domain-containing protein [Proteus mirabilis]
MAKINSLKLIFSSILLLLLAIYGFYVSITHYLDYFLMKDKILFSFLTGLFGFGSPIILYFSYFGIILAYQKTPTKKAIKAANYLAGIAIFGVFFSLFFSFYIQINLVSKGYYSCDKPSIFAPNKYVVSKAMCK